MNIFQNPSKPRQKYILFSFGSSHFQNFYLFNAWKKALEIFL